VNLKKQAKTPLFDALKKYVEDGTVSFHVPGHKGGRGIPELVEYIGSKALSIDVNGMEDLDNICNPISVIKESQELTAEAFKADYAHFLVNGTTSGVQAMIMSVCSPGDKIIVPRNAHKSVIGGLILSGAYPVYVKPEINDELGIAMGITPKTVREALCMHPDARAIFVINPTYYGSASNLKEIVRIAHKHGVLVLVDEAHGAHFPFHPQLPVSAMEAGADMSAVSMHKLGGSMTQSALLLVKDGLIDNKKVKSIMNLTQTTSASYLLMVSLELARKQLALEGRQLLDNTIQLAEKAREKINNMAGLYCPGKDLEGQPGCFAYDVTKLVVNVKELGISGYQVEKILRRDYRIQIELSDLGNILALVTIGDNGETVSRLVQALDEIACTYRNKKPVRYSVKLPSQPEGVVSPREAFYGEKKTLFLDDAEGEISAEMIMAYPPGIPIICPGERITKEVIDYVKLLKTEFCLLQGPQDPEINYIRVLKHAYSIAEVTEFQKQSHK